MVKLGLVLGVISSFLALIILDSEATALIRTAVGTEAKANGGLTATLHLSKKTFLEDEPIEITLKICNGTDECIFLFDELPTAHPLLCGSHIEFWEKDHRIKVKVLEMNEAGGLMRGIDLKPGEIFSTTVFLQRYLEQPSVGEYEISYLLDFIAYRESAVSPLTGEATGPRDRLVIHDSGTLAFAVHPSEPKQLQEIYQSYEKQLSGDHQSARVAGEALLVVDNPLVVPHVIKVLTSNLRPHGALESLARFPKEKAAVQAVVGCLGDRDPSIQSDALEILTNWRYEIKLDEVRKLLKATDNRVHHAAVEYIKVIDLPEYDDLLSGG